MQLEALYEKIDELIAFEPRWYIWSEVDKQIFKNLPYKNTHHKTMFFKITPKKNSNIGITIFCFHISVFQPW